MSRSRQWGGLAILLLLAALFVGRSVNRSDLDARVVNHDQRAYSHHQADLEAGDSIVRSRREREISVRRQVLRSIRVITKLIDIDTNETEELGFDWIQAPFDQQEFEEIALEESPFSE